MLSILLFSANAILPIVLLIALGYFLRSKRIVAQEFFQQGNKLVFRLFLPTMVFSSIYSSAGTGGMPWDFVGFALATVAVVFFVCLAAVYIFRIPQRSRGVILQCGFRSNMAIVGLPLSRALGGDEGVLAISLLIAVIVPVFNILGVVSLTMFQPGERKGFFRQILFKTIKNPLIIAAIAAFVILGLEAVLPVNAGGEPVFTLSGTLPFVTSVIETVSDTCSGLALIILGGMLDLRSVRGRLKELCLGTALRTVVCPLVGLSIAMAVTAVSSMSFTPGQYAALLSLYGAPVATSAAIMAEEMTDDGELARQLAVSTSIVPIATLFIFSCVLRYAGLI